uniref:SHSP domain-containing protein n=1 Tax=Aegilops tauschii TaxID=37682 RepID=M8BYI7_AEGTA
MGVRTCTTVSWTFRNFYEKALLEYEKHKIETGEFHVAASTLTERIASDSQVGGSLASGSGRARRESATRAMQGWHSQRLLGNGEIADPVIKDKAAMPVLKKDKNPKSSGLAKRKRTPTLEDEKATPYKSEKLQNDSTVIDMGPPADWVKINVRRTKDCYEVYALVPGLLREEVHVQSDPAGRLIVTGEPEQLDNPWGVTPFKKAEDTVLQADVWCFDRWQRCCDGNQDASGVSDGMHGTGEPATAMLQARNPEVVATYALRIHII